MAEEITPKPNTISVLAPSGASKEITRRPGWIKLYSPGTYRSRPGWHVRGRDKHGRTIEGRITDEQAAAPNFCQRLLDAANSKPPPLPTPAAPEKPESRLELERKRRAVPQAIALGPFEAWLIETFRLAGESVVYARTGRQLKFYHMAGGYKQAQIPYEDWIKRVLEHRLKFLLAHGWLPASIDHDNGIRDDNRIANLLPSTPALQTHGVQRRRAQPADDL